MNSTKTQSRTGKIARLPHDIREQLNQRLLDNQSGSKICKWLNSLAATTAVCKDFARRTGTKPLPINERNLSQWRRGGFKEWLLNQQTLEQTRQLVDSSVELAQTDNGGLSEGTAVLLNAQIFQLIRSLSTVDWSAEIHSQLQPRKAAVPGRSNATDQAAKSSSTTYAECQPQIVNRKSLIVNPLSLLNTLSRIVSRMRSGEHQRIRLSQRQQVISLQREKCQNKPATLAAEAENPARETKNEDTDYRPRLEILGREMYGNLWPGVEGYSDHWYSDKSIEELEAGYEDSGPPIGPRAPKPPGFKRPTRPYSSAPNNAATPPRPAEIPSTPNPGNSQAAQSPSTAAASSEPQIGNQPAPAPRPSSLNSESISPNITSYHQKPSPANNGTGVPTVPRSAEHPLGPSPATPPAAANSQPQIGNRQSSDPRPSQQAAQSPSTATVAPRPSYPVPKFDPKGDKGYVYIPETFSFRSSNTPPPEPPHRNRHSALDSDGLG